MRKQTLSEANVSRNNGKEEIDEIWKTFKSEVSGENKINQASSKEEGANQSQVKLMSLKLKFAVLSSLAKV